MNTRQIKAVAATLLTAATIGLAVIATSSPANAWPCFPRCGTPLPSSSVPASITPRPLAR